VALQGGGRETVAVARRRRSPRLRQNLPQFTLLVVVNAMVGAIAILTFASGVVAAVRMTETAPPATRVVRRPLSIA
jgi:hypothetical protein